MQLVHQGYRLSGARLPCATNHHARELHAGRRGRPSPAAAGLLQTQREPFLVLDKDLRVVSANRSFYQSSDPNYQPAWNVPFVNEDASIAGMQCLYTNANPAVSCLPP